MRRRLASATNPVHRHSLLQLLVDGALVALAYYLAFRLRFDRGVPARYDELLQKTIVPVVVGTVIIFGLSGMYQRWWRFLGQRDYERLLRGVVIATLALVGLVALIHPVRVQVHRVSTAVSLPLGVAALFFLLTLLFCGGARFLVRAVRARPPRGFHPGRDARDVLIVSAGSGGQAILREILRNPALGFRPVGFLDDNPRMRGLRHEEGVPVIGGTTGNELPRVVDEVDPDEVIMAIPSAPGTLRARVMKACRDRGIPVRTLPTVFELLQSGGNMMRQVRELRVEDVLGREPVRIELERVGAYLNGQVVLVTGAGGSIGAELCRQIARVGPQRPVLPDHPAGNLFGNVLGSSGSVVPIFRRQIAAGGPVTVTDPEMTRYFMTIPEAVQLIIRSGSLRSPGRPVPVYVLDMGDPVRIVELARDMIRLSGLDPDRDIAIEVVGRRPGEKLHEQLFNPDERAKPTAVEKIQLAEREPPDPDWVESVFDQVNMLVLEDNADALAARVVELADARATTGVRTAP